ncbi:FecCD family ABC transporter permease [Embleya sp. NPDC020886]|uniref:FecCD family ABC transporter permease n=1 Tax=Embleya sp. NPDC020886 TaxID=3363980 RepID=UPI003787F0B5
MTRTAPPVAAGPARPTRPTRSVHPRRIGVLLVLATSALVLFVLSLGSGELALSPTEVLEVLAGRGSSLHETVVLSWRMPRAVLALTLGAALAVSGTVFQSLTRNPLGSPDIMGFDTGAYTGALIAVMMLHGSYLETTIGALVGGLATAAVVYVFAIGRGVQGTRLIVVGIGVTGMLSSVNTWLIHRADLAVAARATMWGAGSLGSLAWEQAVPALVCTVILFALLVPLVRGMRMLELGDDTAAALGVSLGSVRMALIAVGVGLAATATAVAGPIAFVSLAAPHIARRLVPGTGTDPVTAAAVGATLLVGADWVAQHGFAPTQVPVGVVTACLGGGYLVWLLLRESRRR